MKIKFFCHGVLKNSNGELLILKREKNDLYPCVWDLPGGFKEIDETYEQCVIREFKEETNLNIKVKKLETVKTQIYGNEIITVLIYSVICSNIDKIKLDDSHSQFKFVDKIKNKNVIWYLKNLNFQNKIKN